MARPRYAYVMGDGPSVEPAHLPPEVALVPAEEPTFDGEGTAFPDAASGDEQRIRSALVRTAGSREQAATLLGMSRVTLWRRMREPGIASRRKRRE